MKVKYQIESINDLNYISGYWCSSDSDAVEIDSQFLKDFSWYDENGNLVWILNEDNTISQTAFLNKGIVIQAMTMPDLLSQVPEALIQIINYVVNGQPIPQDVIDSWNAAYSAHEDALAQGVTP